MTDKNENYVLERTVGDGSKLRAELTPRGEWLGDEPLRAACIEVQAMLSPTFSPALGEPSAYLATSVARQLKCTIVSSPPPPTPDNDGRAY